MRAPKPQVGTLPIGRVKGQERIGIQDLVAGSRMEGLLMRPRGREGAGLYGEPGDRDSGQVSLVGLALPRRVARREEEADQQSIEGSLHGELPP
jgi:hypothetical protein